MSFFYNISRSQLSRQSSAGKKHIPIQLMNELGCKACPSNPKESELTTPKMDPDGSSNPSLYILGEHPSDTDDRKGFPFSGKSGNFLKSFFHQSFLDREVRFQNILRCMPLENEVPEIEEIECCRGFIERDIEASKPLVVVGMGNLPLTWATRLSGGVIKWRGTLVPIKMGSHTCWYYPMYHPSQILMKQGRSSRKSDIEIAFEHDLNSIIGMVENETLPPVPTIYDSDFDKGIVCINGESGSDFSDLETFLNELLKETYIGIDIETSGLRPYHDNSKILTCAVGTFDRTVAFAFDHPRDGWSTNAKKKVYHLFGEFLVQSGRKIAHNLAFEMEWLAHFYDSKILRLTEWEDSYAQAHTIDEKPGTHSLDVLTRKHFGFFLKEKSNADASKIFAYALDEVLTYNGMDTKWTYKLFFEQQKQIEANPKFYREYERKINLIPTLVLSQKQGVEIDFDYADKMQKILQVEVDSVIKKLSQCVEIQKYNKKFADPFRPSATEDVIKLLKDICFRDEIKKEDGGYTSNEDVLNKIPEDEVPSAKLVLEYRTVSKLLSTYIDPIINRSIIHNDKKAHTQYSGMIAVTGRLASENPNLQNFPIRKHKDIRGIIIPSEGCWLVPCDYGQIEARVIGMVSEDANLVKYLWTGYDIHGYWGGRFLEEYPKIKDWLWKDLKIDVDNDKLVHKTIRQEAKNKWVFPQFFGSHYTSCARDMHVPDDVAKSLMDEFWDEFKGVKKWQEKLIKFHEKNLYVETLGGRRRRGVMSKNELINHPIQGTAADIVTKAMSALSELSMEMEDESLQPPLNVHDDLTFNIPDTELEDKLTIITTEMCKHRFEFINVPLIVEVKAGTRWHQMEEIGVYRSDQIFNIRNPYK